MDEMEVSLKEEQDKILSSLSQVLPDSSQETLLNAEEMERVNNQGKLFEISCEEVGESVSFENRSVRRKIKKTSCPFVEVKRKRGGRPRKKKPFVEESDSGFGTSSGEVLKNVTPDDPDDHHSDDSEDSITSMESVSLLQTASCTAMEVDEATTGLNLAWNVKVFPPLDDDDDDEDEKPETISSIDKAVQTSHAPLPSGGNIMRNVNFVSSVIRLKQMFSAHAGINRKDFEKILKRLPETEELESPVVTSSSDDTDEIEVAGEDGMPIVAEKSHRKRRREMISWETVRYIMRKTNTEDVTERSVDSILVWLKEETERDWRMVCCYWDGSVNAEAVDVINEAVDSGIAGIRKRVSRFLADILDDIHVGGIEDAITEFKVAFLSNFCKSILLQYDLILHVNEKLSAVVSRDSEWKEQEIANAKKTYFTLRLLEDLFQAFRTSVNGHGFEEVFRERTKEADAGILNMWRKNWMKDDAVADDFGHLYRKYLREISGWCRQTDEILSFSMRECPLLSLVSQQCSSLAREILSRIQTVREEEM